MEFEVSQAEVDALRGPVGLNLGGRTPPEIALAIVAEMTAVRRGAALDGSLVDWSGSATECLTSTPRAGRPGLAARSD
jgi:xanthine dehydrogenase accessory factor